MNVSGTKKIHPIVIYPFVQPKNTQSLSLLYATLSELANDPRYNRPVTIVNNQTKFRCTERWSGKPDVEEIFKNSISQIITQNSLKVTYEWSVDTCAMWLRGLGDSYEEAEREGNHHDVFWLIPGDFDFSTDEGKIALHKISEIPLRVFNAECDISLGEIDVPISSSKQLIDTYGTYGLLYNWFPAEAQGIRRITDKPRTEFFAINYGTLSQSLIPNRWYAYEQTLMILLQNMDGSNPVRPIKKVSLGKITDEESTRSTLAAAMQQVERTERALKLFWRERAIGRSRPTWQDDFRILDAQSESVRTSAMVILRRVLA